MAKKIVILEDNADRQAAMRACVADRFYTFETRFFDNAPDTIAYLRENLAETLVISLDNDLEPNDQTLEAGEGRHVAEYLAVHAPVCPVVIHTSNSNAAVAMEESLRGSGWKTRRVLPFDDTKWIEDDWFFVVRRLLVGPVRRNQITGSIS